MLKSFINDLPHWAISWNTAFFDWRFWQTPSRNQFLNNYKLTASSSDKKNCDTTCQKPGSSCYLTFATNPLSQ